MIMNLTIDGIRGSNTMKRPYYVLTNYNSATNSYDDAVYKVRVVHYDNDKMLHIVCADGLFSDNTYLDRLSDGSLQSPSPKNLKQHNVNNVLV